MKKVIVFKILILIVFISSAVKVQAEDIELRGVITLPEEELTYDFSQAVKQALRCNHDLVALEKQVFAAEKNINIKKSRFYPSVGFDQGFVWTNIPARVFALKLNQKGLTPADFAGAPATFNSPDSFTNFLSEFSITQSVYDKENFVQLDIAKTRFSKIKNEYVRAKEKTAFQVAKAYLMAKTAREFVCVSRQAIEDAHEHLRIAKVRYKNELGLYSDVLRTNTALKKAEQTLVSAKKNYEVAKKTLGLIIGLSASVKVTDSMPELNLYDYKRYKKQVLTRNDLKASKLEYKNAKKTVDLAKAKYYPDLMTGGSYQIYGKAPFGYEGNYFKLFALLKWDIFDGTRRKNEIEKAEYNAQSAKELMLSDANKAQFDVFEAYQTVKEKKQNLKLAKSSLDSAKEGMRLVQVRYKNNLAPIVDVLDAQLNLNQARADYTKSKNEYLFSLINLSFAGGTLLEDLCLENLE